MKCDDVIQPGETEAIKRSVEAGPGVALIQRIAVEREIAAGTLCALTLHGGDDRRTYAYARRRWSHYWARPGSAWRAVGDDD